MAARARTAPTLAMVSKALVDFVEEQRRVGPDSAGLEVPQDASSGDRNAPAGDGNAPSGDGNAPSGDGYAPGQRSALDTLLDAQEKREPSTAI